MFRHRIVDRRECYRKQRELRLRLKSLPSRCAVCGISIEPVIRAAAQFPELLAMHLESAPECVERYCEQPDNLVDLEAGKLGIRQTLFVCKYAGGSGVGGIAPCGERRIFYFDPRRRQVEDWLRGRLGNGEGRTTKEA